MDPKDQREYGPGVHPDDDPHPPPKTDRLERDEQHQFVNWCLLQNLPFVWHATNRRSTANAGVPDFLVGVSHDVTLWIEFKRTGFKLAPDQEKFRDLLAGRGIQLYVVYSALEAIELLRQFIELDKPA